MKLSHFNFDLPEGLLAEHPAENRDESRLMVLDRNCLLYTSPSPRDRTRSRMPSSA